MMDEVVCTTNSDTVNSKIIEKGYTLVKSAKKLNPAKQLKHATKDTLKNARKIKQKTEADLEMNVPSSTNYNKVNVKLMQQRPNMTFLKK